MHFSTPGRVKVAGKAVDGRLLMTDRSIFVLDSGAKNSSTGMAVGGLLGYFIGRYFDRKKAKQQPSAHLQDPEIVALGAEVQDSLLTTRLLAKLPLNGTLEVKPTLLGFEFIAPGQPPVSYAGWAKKKKIARFLTDRGVHISAAK